MINQQKMPCPDCKSDIPFDPYVLIQGGKFACPQCTAIIALANESIDATKSALNAYERLKLDSNKNKEG